MCDKRFSKVLAAVEFETNRVTLGKDSLDAKVEDIYDVQTENISWTIIKGLFRILTVGKEKTIFLAKRENEILRLKSDINTHHQVAVVYKRTANLREVKEHKPMLEYFTAKLHEEVELLIAAREKLAKLMGE